MMKKKTIITIILVIILLSYFTYADVFSQPYNKPLMKSIADTLYCSITGGCDDSDNEFLIDVASCIDNPCFVNASNSGKIEYLIYADNPGIKYLWRSEP